MSGECLGCQTIETKPVTLLSGTVVCSSCPAYLAECESRMLAAMTTNTRRTAYLARVEAARGKDAAQELRSATMAVMRQKCEY